MRRRLGEILQRFGVSGRQVEEALAMQSRQPGTRLGQLLVRLGAVTPEDLARALAQQLELPYVDPLEARVDPQVAWLLPYEHARRLGAMPVAARPDHAILVAMADPTNVEALSELEFRLGTRVRPAVCSTRRLEQALARYHGIEALAGRAIDRLQRDRGDTLRAPDRLKLDAKAIREHLQRGGTQPYVDIVNLLLVSAIERRASDIHFEPMDDDFRVRFRVDGMLQTVLHLPPWAAAPVATRLKVIGQMDVAQRRLPQDGNADVTVQGRTINLRISSVPSRLGEKIVVRLLDPRVLELDLGDLGWPPDLVGVYYRLIAAPAGLVLVVGPTGSGKSTTLYASINRLNDETRAIATIEDPVEYTIRGITQVQVNRKAGVTFAAAIRSMLRQDPNVLVIGEIRDPETAEAAVDAANTGHLVLSTLHTANTVAAIARLNDLGVPGYLLGAALSGVVSQRLLRRVCPRCSLPDESGPGEWRRLGLQPVDLGPRARRAGPGCEHCQLTGYRGRVGVFELLPVDERIARLVQDGATEAELWEAFLAAGHRTLLHDAVSKIREGVTTFDELARVVPVGEYPDAVVAATVARLAAEAVRVGAASEEGEAETPLPAGEAPGTPAEAPPVAGPEAAPVASGPGAARNAEATGEAEAAPGPAALPAEAISPLDAPEPPRRPRPLVLVVDDAAEIRDLVSLTLEDDFEVATAADGAEALDAIARLRPDAVVLDVMMPGFSGYEVTERVRATPDTADLPVLLLSARGQPEHRKAGLHAGADDYLPKPFDPEELLLRVKALLRRAGRLG